MTPHQQPPPSGRAAQTPRHGLNPWHEKNAPRRLRHSLKIHVLYYHHVKRFNLPSMKVTEYFKAVCLRPDRMEIKMEWIKSTIESSLKREIQSDGRIRCWSKIKEKDKYLRVILLEDGETVHNAFFDRGFKEE